MTNEDYRFLIDCITTELVSIVMEREQKELADAMETVLNSRTYDLLCTPDAGLTAQSPEYVYQIYQKVG